MRYILVLMLLSGCSTSIFTDKNSKESASIENRDVKNKSTDLNQNPNIRVNKVDDPKIETVKIVSDRKDPNKLFENYSVYFDLDEYTVQDKYKFIWILSKKLPMFLQYIFILFFYSVLIKVKIN